MRAASGAAAPTSSTARYHDTEWGLPGRRRHPAVREALPRGVPVGPLVADDPAQARGLPRGVRRASTSGAWPSSARTMSSGCSATPASSGTAARSSRRSTTRPGASISSRPRGRWPRTSGRSSPTRADRPAVVTWDALRAMAQTDASRALARDLKRRGWSFVGPTTVYAFMQAMGLVNDHVEGCDCPAAARTGGGRPDAIKVGFACELAVDRAARARRRPSWSRQSGRALGQVAGSRPAACRERQKRKARLTVVTSDPDSDEFARACSATSTRCRRSTSPAKKP